MSSVSTDLLLEIGIALSREKDADELLMIILSAAMDITRADGGTLYIVDGDALRFHILCTRSMNILRCAHKEAIDLPPVALDKKNVCAYCAIERELVNIPDVYKSDKFDFAGPRNYDAITGYRTHSMLVVPMEDDQGDIIGVLQLINAQDDDGTIVAFDPQYESVVRSLTSQAAIRLTNMNYASEVTELLDSFVRVMSTAIDARSPYNANHTRNMVAYADRFIDRIKTLKSDWDLSAQRSQFLMSIWLHDVGKLTIPLEIMDKETRLADKLRDVMHRLSAMRMWNMVDHLTGKIDEAAHDVRVKEIDDVEALIHQANRAGFIDDELFERVQTLKGITYRNEHAEVMPLLTEQELSALSIRRGTLTSDERDLMESHVLMTRRMLESMAFSKSYRDVPDWAARHHEMLDGSGYPDKLSGDAIPPEVRLLSIIDIFDALTARDRPYKRPLTPESALKILSGMADSGKLDKDILALFAKVKPWEV